MATKGKNGSGFYQPMGNKPSRSVNAPLPMVRFIHTKMWIIKRKKEAKKEKGNNSNIFN
jgi:hypothetical protein